MPAVTIAERRELNTQGRALKLTLRNAMAAKLLAEVAAREKQPADPGDDATPEQVDVWAAASVQADEDAGLYAVQSAVRAAEDALIAWADAAMQKVFPAKYKAVEIVFTQGVRKPKFRQPLIDLTIRLEL